MERYTFKRVGLEEISDIKALFVSVFTIEPWNDDWSDEAQLDAYIRDLIGQGNSLTYALYDANAMIALSMGRVKHWYSGTEYCIDELCVKTSEQGKGIGSYFLSRIETDMRQIGIPDIFLLTDRDVPAFEFYRKNGFRALEQSVSLAKTGRDTQ